MSYQPAKPLSVALGLGLVLFAAGCAGPVEPRPIPKTVKARTSVPPVAATRRAAHERAAVIAVRQVGIPYRYGGADRSGFDCSGLVQYSYRQVGKALPRTTSHLWRELAPVSRAGMRVGDVLFFRIEGKVSHVGLYLGDGRFVHAPSSGREVTVAALDAPYYRQAFVRAGRP